ncbi:hypothetical protein EG329_005039 [Mollisiaceae sp. DMI_Dod_QoI]|nr:hypothetical protein EG329_005039 [Helotiales sp. DMI_Dod_QoI]
MLSKPSRPKSLQSGVATTLKADLRERESEGYNREAYEYRLEIGRNGQPKFTKAALVPDTGRYLVKINGHLTPELIKQLSGSTAPPKIEHGNADDGDAEFCVVSAALKQTLMDACTSSGVTPTFVRFVEPAPKIFSSISKYTTLGIDTTLPQHRSELGDDTFLPAQSQYPVWYFFYGTLAQPEVLTRHLGLSSEPQLHPAAIRHGVLRTWAGKYKALADGPESSCVDGMAYKVSSEAHEAALRGYETNRYEVVRCTIEMKGELVPGCTFRFVGTTDTLK